jgi:3-oxoadipate enol-lactonase
VSREPGKSSRVRIGDVDIFYRWDGPDGGPVVMMAHAMGTSHRLWDWQVPALADRYRVLRYDWRGHGDTDAPEGPYSLDMFVADAVGLMDALGLEKVHWAGISTGGMIGQGLGIEHFDRVSSLALCNTPPQANQAYKDFVAERHAILREHGMTRIWDMTVRRWFTDDFAEAAGRDYQTVRDVFIRTPVAGYIGATSATANLAYRDRLHMISAPTLVLGAGDDRQRRQRIPMLSTNGSQGRKWSFYRGSAISRMSKRRISSIRRCGRSWMRLRRN